MHAISISNLVIFLFSLDSFPRIEVLICCFALGSMTKTVTNKIDLPMVELFMRGHFLAENFFDLIFNTMSG